MSDEHKNESPGTWLGEIEGHLWAMRPESLSTLYRLAADGTLGARFNAEAIEAARSRGRPRAIQGDVQTIALKGVLAPMGGLFALLFGDFNPLDSFRASLREAMSDDEVGAIIIDVDSPGGVVDHIPEAAAEMRALKARHNKPVVAVANTLTASAAYWIASQADEVVATPSAAVGSIGVYATHRDMSGAMKLMGVETTLISAGKYKTEGNPWEPLSDEARAHIQEDVDDFYAMFVADVARGRSAPGKSVKAADVKNGYGEGLVLNAKRALAANLIDRVETIGETAARLSSRGRGGVTTRAEADAGADTLEEAEANAGAEQANRREHAKLAALMALD
jgi:capsid assembly protease